MDRLKTYNVLYINIEWKKIVFSKKTQIKTQLEQANQSIGMHLKVFCQKKKHFCFRLLHAEAIQQFLLYQKTGKEQRHRTCSEYCCQWVFLYKVKWLHELTIIITNLYLYLEQYFNSSSIITWWVMQVFALKRFS